MLNIETLRCAAPLKSFGEICVIQTLRRSAPLILFNEIVFYKHYGALHLKLMAVHSSLFTLHSQSRKTRIRQKADRSFCEDPRKMTKIVGFLFFGTLNFQLSTFNFQLISPSRSK